MKLAPSIFVSLSLAAYSIALAAETDRSVPASSINVFAGPLTIGGHPAPAPSSEELSSPFVEAHFVEQTLYANRYFAHYRVVPDNINAPAPEEPTSPTDTNGRPLWFDGRGGESILENLVVRLIEHRQFDDLDRLFEDWSNPSERMADGRWKLVAFYDAVGALLAQSSEWAPPYQYIREWKGKNPKSRAAALTEAIYWYKYAWNARGQGSASSVTDEGWKLFQDRLEKAQASLTDSSSYAASSPLWGRLEIDIGLGLGWSKEDLLKVFEESSAKEKYFYPIYQSMVKSLTPKWGGDWKLVDDFVRAAVKNTEAVEGYSMYARLYWSVDSCDCEQSDLFHASLANWTEMKRGFDDLVRRYPHSAWIVNKYAAYACMADDKQTFLSVRLRMGKLAAPDAWPQNHSLDLCDHKFPAQPL